MYVDVYVLYIRSRMCTLSCTYHSGPCLRNLCTYVYVYKGEKEGEGGWVGLRIHGVRMSGGGGRKATPDNGSSRER